MLKPKKLRSDLTPHWVTPIVMICILISYHIICHTIGTEIQISVTEEQRLFIRTVLYVIAIILFPLVNLIRFILLRLNQTMPGDDPAKNRYLVTTIVTLVLIEIVGVFGMVMFILGDGYNTLYIFTALAALGIFLHRPKQEEYLQIINALATQTRNN